MLFNLAPLSTRRDIAMLGVVHRAVLRRGPKHFFRFFQVSSSPYSHFLRRRHSRHLRDLRGPRALDIHNRSILGLSWIYNLLPAHIVELSSITDFQSALQDLVRARAISGCDDWASTLSPRIPSYCHPLASN